VPRKEHRPLSERRNRQQNGEKQRFERAHSFFPILIRSDRLVYIAFGTETQGAKRLKIHRTSWHWEFGYSPVTVVGATIGVTNAGYNGIFALLKNFRNASGLTKIQSAPKKEHKFPKPLIPVQFWTGVPMSINVCARLAKSSPATF